MQYNISKTYSVKVTINYQSQNFSTSLTKTIEVTNAKELLAESDKLFKQAKSLTDRDIANFSVVTENAK